ncbi:hypothetical protein BC828DRAFT_386251 [Blastocladiella britannica]|nr:hypothetical protein BC828DRAFT_386251 [Blastocladiella britannica]
MNWRQVLKRLLRPTAIGDHQRGQRLVRIGRIALDPTTTADAVPRVHGRWRLELLLWLLMLLLLLVVVLVLLLGVRKAAVTIGRGHVRHIGRRRRHRIHGRLLLRWWGWWWVGHGRIAMGPAVGAAAAKRWWWGRLVVLLLLLVMLIVHGRRGRGLEPRLGRRRNKRRASPHLRLLLLVVLLLWDHRCISGSSGVRVRVG